MEVREAEIVDDEQQHRREPHLHVTQVRAVGLLGAFLAGLTMLAALGVGFVALFSTTLIMAAIVFIVWPMVFSPDFTAWVFGTERAPFWKIFLLFLAAGFVAKLFRRHVWQRR